MRSLLLSTLLVPLLLVATPAWADDAAVAQAKQRFSAGKTAYSEGRYKDAVELFTQANALDPHAELLYNVGQAYEKLDDVANALRVFREYLRLLPAAADRAVVEQKCQKFQERLRARGVQQVTVLASPLGAGVILDDRPVGQAPWTGEIAPGRHKLVLKAQGYADGVRDFELAPDRAMDVEVSLSRPSATPAVTPAGGPAPLVPTGPGPVATDGGAKQPSTTPPPDVTPQKRRIAPWTYAALGLGVGAFGASIGLEVARKGAESSARNDPTQTGFQSDLNQMTTFQTASRAFAGVGAALTVTGGVLLLVDLKPWARDETAPKAAVGCFTGACGAFAAGKF